MASAMKKDDLESDVRRSIRYHSRRRSFYERCHRSIMFLVILLSSNAIFSLIPKEVYPSAPTLMNAIIVAIASLDLVIGFSSKAKDHEILYKKYYDLQIQIQTQKASPEARRSWLAEYLKIEMEEPPKYEALDISCHNEEARAMGCHASEYYKLNIAQKLFMHLWRFSDTDWKRLEPIPPNESS